MVMARFAVAHHGYAERSTDDVTEDVDPVAPHPMSATRAVSKPWRQRVTGRRVVGRTSRGVR